MAIDCYWHNVFDEPSRDKFESGTVFIASVSAILSLWLLATILLSNLRADPSYRNLAFFIFASFMRCAVTVIWYLPFFKTNLGGAVEGDVELSCNFYGFFASFISVYEVECFTHVCIERYVVAKYITNGWEMQKKHYPLYQFLSVMFALAYALPPVFGVGRSAADFSCSSCILDMVLPDTWDRYVIVIIYLLRSVKSTGFIITMLVWARQREAHYDNSKHLAKQARFTQNVVVVTAVNLFCWMPITVTRASVIFSSLVHHHVGMGPSAAWVQYAMWMQWIAPAATVVALVLLDDNLRNKITFNKDSELEDTKKD